MPRCKMPTIQWNRLPCGSCLYGCKPYFCREKIPVGKQQQEDLLREGTCHAYKFAFAETLSDKD